MPKFVFRAKDWSGKVNKGEVMMSSEAEVLASIRDNGWVPINVKVVQENVLDDLKKKYFSRVTLKQVSNFTRQLSTMMTAGLPLTDSLSLLRSQVGDGTTMFTILDHALTTVRGGMPLGKALAKYKSVFGEAYVASINAGEEGGVLEEVLAKLATNLEKQSEFQGKVKGAMIYPTIVVIGMLLVAFMMMIFVVPKLMALYEDFGTNAKMPAATLALMSISRWAVKLWFLVPIAVVGLVALFKVGNKNLWFRTKIDGFKLKIPIFGPLAQKTILVDTIRTMSMLLTAGISLVDCLRIVAEVSGNELYRQAFNKISEKVQKGFSIASSFEETEMFPLIVNQMVSTGEATGKLDEVLMKVSNYFATEAEEAVKAMTSAIEPLIMIVLGIGVGFLVIAVIMPIYNLTSSF